MKALKVLSTAAVVAILFTACKKDEAEKTTIQKIQAKWSIEKETTHDFYLGVHSRDTTYGAAGDYVDFRNDGKVYYKTGMYMDTSSYALLGGNKIVTNYGLYSDTVDIITLNDNQFQVYFKETAGADYYETTRFFIK